MSLRRRGNIETALIDPGKPWQNGADECFNGALRDECLSVNSFETFDYPRAMIEACRIECSERRPHMALDEPSARAVHQA